MNIQFVTFVEAVKTGRSSDEILFAMDEHHQIRLDTRTNLIAVMNRVTKNTCHVPLSNVKYFYEKMTTPSLEGNAKK